MARFVLGPPVSQLSHLETRDCHFLLSTESTNRVPLPDQPVFLVQLQLTVRMEIIIESKESDHLIIFQA